MSTVSLHTGTGSGGPVGVSSARTVTTRNHRLLLRWIQAEIELSPEQAAAAAMVAEARQRGLELRPARAVEAVYQECWKRL